jgi:hypothetical protein
VRFVARAQPPVAVRASWPVLRRGSPFAHWRLRVRSGTFKLQGPSVSLTTERPFCLEFSDHTRQKKAPVIMVRRASLVL